MLIIEGLLNSVSWQKKEIVKKEKISMQLQSEFGCEQNNLDCSTNGQQWPMFQDSDDVVNLIHILHYKIVEDNRIKCTVQCSVFIEV